MFSPVAKPDPALANDPSVSVTQASVVKIRAVKTKCQKIGMGSGFVVAPNRVMATAHGVAGSDSVSIEGDDTSYDASVVLYDPMKDIAILDVPNLGAQPLTFAATAATFGADAIMLGYSGGGSFTATPARIREVFDLNGPDIYRSATVTRQVYAIRGNVTQGMAGGPLIDTDGNVLGVMFGAAQADPDTGFAMTANEVAHQMGEVGNTAPVATGECPG